MAISVVQTASANSTSLSFGSNTTPGNTIVVCVGAFDNSPVISGVTIGGLADNFAQAVAPGVGGKCWAGMWVDFNCGQAATGLVVSGSGLTVDSNNGGVVAYEISGGFSLVDQSASQGTSGSANWSSGTAPATTQANEIWIGCCDTNHPVATEDAAFTSTHLQYMAAGYKIVSSTGTPAYSGTQTASDIAGAAVMALGTPPPAGGATKYLTGSAAPALVVASM